MLIVKPWGSEELIEKNDHYVVKKLTMKAGHRCSLQFHKEKHETFYVVSGKLLFTFGDSIDNLTSLEFPPGSSYVIPPGLVHRMAGLEDSVYIECSTNQLEDVVRLQDDHGRN